MNPIDLNDFIMDIMQDFNEIESMLKVLKDSVYNENHEISMTDIGNSLEIIIAKMSNTKSLFEKYIDMTF